MARLIMASEHAVPICSNAHRPRIGGHPKRDRRCADSLAMSVEMPMSAARKAGPSLIPVAHESDDVPLAPEGAYDPLLLRGRGAGEERGLLRRLGQFVIGHFFDVCA
jgi:hypothetical protein